MSKRSESRRASSGPPGSRKALEAPLAGAPWQRSVLGGLAVGGVVANASMRIPLGLPGHRALGWLTILIVARLLLGPRSAAIVGVASAGAVLALGISPDGVWGVAQYAAAGLLIDAALYASPRFAQRPIALSLLGAGVLLAVGWIAPIGQSLTGGVPISEIWSSLGSIAGAGINHVLMFDAAFGAIAGAMAWAAYAMVTRLPTLQQRGGRASSRLGAPA